MGSGRRTRHNRTGRQKDAAVQRPAGRVARPRENWIEAPFPAIVDPALFARAQDQACGQPAFLGTRDRRADASAGVVRLRALRLRQGTNSGTVGRNDPPLHDYRCHGTGNWRYPEEAVCDNPFLRAAELDDAVRTEVLVLLQNPDFIQGEINRRLEAANDTAGARRRTDALQGELARITTRMRRLLDAYQNEIITLDDLKERKTPLQARSHSIQSEPGALKAAELDHGARLSLATSMEQFLGRLREGVRSLSLAECQRIVRLLVRQVRLGKDEITICHSIPIPTPPPHRSSPSGNDTVQVQLLNPRCRENIQSKTWLVHMISGRMGG